MYIIFFIEFPVLLWSMPYYLFIGGECQIIKLSIIYATILV